MLKKKSAWKKLEDLENCFQHLVLVTFGESKRGGEYFQAFERSWYKKSRHIYPDKTTMVIKHALDGV